MKQHFVKFLSPGSFVDEINQEPVETWDVEAATERARHILQRHNATPYAFQFFTRGRGDEDLDSKVIKESPTYFLGGTVYTLEEIEARNDPNDRILISNMKGNDYDRIIENNNSWKHVAVLGTDDIVLDFEVSKEIAP